MRGLQGECEDDRARGTEGKVSVYAMREDEKAGRANARAGEQEGGEQEGGEQEGWDGLKAGEQED